MKKQLFFLCFWLKNTLNHWLLSLSVRFCPNPQATPIQALKNAGKPVDDALLQYLSPLGWEHINLTGDYVWLHRQKENKGKFRPLRIVGNY